MGRLLAQRGALVVDADRVGHAVLEPYGEAYAAVRRRWPHVMIEGRVDRAALARVVFTDRAELARLEEVTHPAIRRRIRDMVAGTPHPLVVVEVPLRGDFMGEGWVRVVVDAPDEVRVARLRARGMEEADIMRRMKAQPSRSEWLAWADLVVDNAGDEGQLEREVDRLLNALHGGSSTD